MTVQTNTNVASFNGNGVTQIFPIAFKFNNDADLVVLLVDSETGASTQLTLNSDYTVSGDGEDEGGAVTVLAAPTSAQRLKVARLVDILQLTDLRNQGKFFAEVHEDAFDLLTMIAQQHESAIRSAIRVAEADPEPARLPSAESRANKVMGFDENGNPIATLPASGSGTELAIDLANTSNPAKGAGMVGYNGGNVAQTLNAHEQRLAEVESVTDNLSAATVTYSQQTGARGATIASALDFLGRSGKEGIFTTPASLGHRAGQLAYRITAGGKAELISDLRKHYPAGAFATPGTVAATGLKAYYVKPSGSDAAAGTDWGTALASIPAALSKSDVDVVFIAAGLYTAGKALGTYSGTRNVALHAVGGDVVFVSAPADALTAWGTTGSAELFRKTSITAEPTGVVALDYVDEYGLPLVLPYRGTDSGALVGTTGYVAYEAGGLWTVFIRLPNGAAPITGRVLFYQSVNMRMAAPNVKFFQKGITYIGGSAGAFSARSGNAASVVISEQCKFAGQRPYDAYQIKDIGLSIAMDCVGAKSANDCFNYHALNGVTPHFIEVNCIGVGAEAAGTGNGSTAHEDVVGIRIGCDYSGNAGPGIADVNDAVTYNAGCTSRGNATYGVIAQADSKVGAGALVYLHACSVGGNTSEDVAARIDGRVRVLDAFYATQRAELGGTITAF